MADVKALRKLLEAARLCHIDDAELGAAAAEALPDLLDALAAAERDRDAALEEAAGVCAAIGNEWTSGAVGGNAGHRCAAAIRALKTGGK